jgi:phosphatidylcholine synthase
MSVRPRADKWHFYCAAAVHVFTALGGALGLLALLSVNSGHWQAAFAWLGAALIVDGADGPLARRFQVAETLPRFSGDDLDKIIDYLTYVTVPAFIVARAPLVPESLRLFLGLTIMTVSLYHFADKRSKTADGYFIGFPALWNIAVFYGFVLGLSPPICAALLFLCAILIFVPLRCVHPFRVLRFRPFTVAVVLAWSAASVTAVVEGFPGSAAVKLIFILTAAYIVALGFIAGVEANPRPGRRPG